MYPAAGHIMTGNLKIISDSRIRYIVSKGPKYEGCSGSSWNLGIKCSNIDILHSYFEISQVDTIELAPHS